MAWTVKTLLVAGALLTQGATFLRTEEPKAWAAEIRQAIEANLAFLRGGQATNSYSALPKGCPVSKAQAEAANLHLLKLLGNSLDEKAFRAAISRDFARIPMSADAMKLTGYFTPRFPASRTREGVYQYPIFSAPEGFKSWAEVPTRLELEGEDGRTPSPLLKGKELLFFPDRFSAYLVGVQGSARCELPSGELISVGYGGATSHPYTSVAKELLKDRRIDLDAFSRGAVSLRAHFMEFPEDLKYLSRNNRFVFFRETSGPVVGSLNVPVTANRTLAVDRKLHPSAVPIWLEGRLPRADGSLSFEERLVFSQDAGSAILADRLDLYFGEGPQAGYMAGKLVMEPVQSSFLLLKNNQEKK